MKRFPILLLGLVFSLAGCSTIDTPKKSAKGDETFRFFNPNVENLPEFAGRSAVAMRTIQEELRERLTDAGLTEVNEDADLLVAYLVIVQNNTVTTAIDDYYSDSGIEIIEAAHEYTQDHKPRRKFTAGTIVVDVIDVAKRKLIYRDFAMREILPDLSEEEREKRVREATDEAIAGFVR
jgi:hypothetical protein